MKAMLVPQCHHHHHSPLPFPPRTLAPPHSPFPESPFFRTPRASTRLQPRFSAPRSEAVPQSAIQRIAEKLRSLGFKEDDDGGDGGGGPVPKSSPTSAGEIFVPLPKRLPKYRVGHTIDTSWSTPENPVPEPGSGGFVERYGELRRKARKERELEREKRRREEKAAGAPTLAELRLSEEELRRLREVGVKLKKRLKIGKAGITEGIVNGIHERWRTAEVVKITCEDLCRMNMKRTHDLLERKTGGLVVWRSGSNIVLYRGADYKYPYFLADDSLASGPSMPIDHDGCDEQENDGVEAAQPSIANKSGHPTLIHGVGSPDKVRFQLPGELELAEEAEKLLDGLGPRFADWWGYEPLPVDADLLPAVVPGYRRPFRLLPYGVNPKLTNDEMTILRRLSRPLPCQFALGRNRNLQGLAASIVKLWEKCEIAKIAVKRGVQNTNSEMMAEELRWLTGGTLLARDREFIVLYRGKDYLPPVVSSAIEERRKCGMGMEKAAESRHGLHLSAFGAENADIDKQRRIPPSEEKKPVSVEGVIRTTGIKLSLALEKKAKAEKLLTELENSENPEQPDVDKEGITQEERYMLRKVGLRMKPFLLLGRRGVYDGTVENMHLHWKYRELVKIICKEKRIETVHQIAQTLEAESGGILVAVERVSKGYAIIVYRGKNYERPACIRPSTLLNKKAAMKHSLEAQRRESLKLHVLKLSENIGQLKRQLDIDKERSDMHSLDGLISPLVTGEIAPMKTLDSLSSDGALDLAFNSLPGVSVSNEEHMEARGDQGNDSASISTSNGADPSLLEIPSRQEDELTGFSVNNSYGDSGKIKPEMLDKSAHGDSHWSVSMQRHNEGCGSQSKQRISNHIDSEHHVCDTKTVELSKTSVPVGDNKQETSVEMPMSRIHLSNKERLLLRKQALRMRKRPVLAVGRSNIVSGVAKTIKMHFQKHPLAIVNLKGRAKGTSIQELVFKLEQATGAILISQEPNKVILYRGWGADVESSFSHNKGREASKFSEKLGQPHPLVSPELMAAIKLECGLPSNHEERAIP
ncbi:LOW QUALITY PROTEIN: CRM-domain containing factor CFM2, chloroplastic [Rhodamnia argentea]|uniref:LOW QUALITY PROTEIN: CRM-domain containing factor CFM2, chloroplastic n=1 Tax=Rhodamnia argentea TaxID=178133 RepID=A0ABM3GWT1_9MYRT|nr:LOW QUALITY PROTEIN: CRM-domain containing factor CFM2, chloroplastic [Rhodamnia argentea]